MANTIVTKTHTCQDIYFSLQLFSIYVLKYLLKKATELNSCKYTGGASITIVLNNDSHHLTFMQIQSQQKLAIKPYDTYCSLVVILLWSHKNTLTRVPKVKASIKFFLCKNFI